MVFTEAHHFITPLSSGLQQAIRANYRQLERAKKLSYKTYLTRLHPSTNPIFILIIVTVNSKYSEENLHSH